MSRVYPIFIFFVLHIDCLHARHLNNPLLIISITSGFVDHGRTDSLRTMNVNELEHAANTVLAAAQQRFLQQDEFYALVYFMKADSIFSHLNNAYGVARTRLGKAQIFIRTQHYQEAKENLIYARSLFVTQQKNNEYIDALTAFGDLFLAIERPDSALNYFLEAAKLIQPNDNVREVQTLCGLAESYAKLYQYEAAYIHSAEALNIATKEGYESLLARCYRVFASIDVYQKRYKEALSKIQRSISLINSHGDLLEQQKTYQILSALYEYEGMYDSALYYHKSYTMVKDSISGKRIQTDPFKLMALRDKSADQYEIQELKADLKKKKMLTTMILIIGFTFVMFTLLFLNRDQVKKTLQKFSIAKED